MASFSKSFAAARKSGKSTFSWNGKSYNTKVASTPKTPKKGPVPSAKPTAATAKPERARADFPKPPKDVGIAKKGSAISNAASRRENAPSSGRSSLVTAANAATLSARVPTPTQPLKDKPQQGPIPEGVWYARKGSPISIAAARRANRPVKK